MSRDDDAGAPVAPDLYSLQIEGRKLPALERVRLFNERVADWLDKPNVLMKRVILSATDRQVEVLDPVTQRPRTMLMFGSNNYLGLANHPYVREKVRASIDELGIGTSGAPHFNGYTRLHAELEERLAALKGQEDAMLFSSGYGANVGVISGLLNETATVYADEAIHASMWDGIRTAGVRSYRRFLHNDPADLERIIEAHQRPPGSKDIMVAVDGVYSMDGDVAPLDQLGVICQRHGAILFVDDAHGTGVLGATGRGITELYRGQVEIDAITGTLGKALGLVGGFAAGSRALCNYLRVMASSYVFATALPPVVVAGVIAALDMLEREPALHQRLWENVERAAAGLRALGHDLHPESAIITLRTPSGMDIMKAAEKFTALGVFVNYVPYPAVPLHKQRFRICISACHRPEDIDRLVAAVEAVWAEQGAAAVG